MKKLYAEISKTEAQEDGTLKVWGYASTEAVDSDGETVTADAMKAALPDYMKFGAVREMHQPSAAGTAIECKVEEDGRTFFGAHVVDPVAVLKVTTGTYKGFSIGGKITERDELNKTIIKGLKLVEISLVDRPANPEAIFTCYKAEGVTDATTDKDAIGGDGIDASGKSDESVDLKKGMYGVSQFADILSSVSWLAESTEWESQYEGDNSPLPADLRTWLSMGVDIFRQMAAEETAEMLASLQAMVPQPMVVETLEQGAKVDDLTKAGSKFSADTKKLISEAHESVKKADDILSKLGYDKAADDEESARAEDTTDATSDKSASTDDLQKVSGELELTKADLAKLSTENATLQERVKELEAEPAEGKAIIKAVVVAKNEDVGSDQVAKVDPVLDAKGEINEVATMIKMAQSHR